MKNLKNPPKAVGRNDLCLCGSEKKYKNCCLNKSDAERRFLFEDIHIPKLNDWFFHYHPLKQISAAMLLHAGLVTPEIEKMADGLTSKMLKRGEDEARIIRLEQNPVKLLDMLQQGIDNLNYGLMRDRLHEYENDVTPVLLDRLRDSENDALIEQGVRFLGAVSDFPLSQIEDLADNAYSPYVRSCLCLLLGVRGPEPVLPLLWKQYHLLRTEYPSESLSQGPLYGLYEYGVRFGLLKL